MGNPASAEPWGQRLLAKELRYRIDVARRAENVQVGDRSVAPIEPARQRVQDLVDQHPKGLRSAHVRHNLGSVRLRWLREKGMIE